MTDEIKLGEFSMARDEDGYLWLWKDTGEAMQCNSNTEADLVSVIDKFWEDTF